MTYVCGLPQATAGDRATDDRIAKPLHCSSSVIGVTPQLQGVQCSGKLAGHLHESKWHGCWCLKATPPPVHPPPRLWSSGRRCPPVQPASPAPTCGPPRASATARIQPAIWWDQLACNAIAASPIYLQLAGLCPQLAGRLPMSQSEPMFTPLVVRNANCILARSECSDRRSGSRLIRN